MKDTIETKWLRFVHVGNKPKTEVWEVQDRGGAKLCTVKYHAPWRQYCDFTDGLDTVWNSECRDELNNFVKGLNLERKRRLNPTTGGNQ